MIQRISVIEKDRGLSLSLLSMNFYSFFCQAVAWGVEVSCHDNKGVWSLWQSSEVYEVSASVPARGWSLSALLSAPVRGKASAWAEQHQSAVSLKTKYLETKIVIITVTNTGHRLHRVLRTHKQSTSHIPEIVILRMLTTRLQGVCVCI